MKLRRSMLFMPGAHAGMLSTAFVFKPDSIMFDLEDAVTLREKDAARILVFHALQHPLYRDIETVVRINPLDTPFGLDDLQAAVRGGAHIVRLPKTDTADDVRQLAAEIERIESACGRAVGSTQVRAAIRAMMMNSSVSTVGSWRFLGASCGVVIASIPQQRRHVIRQRKISGFDMGKR